MRLDCPLCHSSEIELLAQMARTPVHQHITFATADDAQRCPRGDMALALCSACGFVFNADFDPELVDYSPGYDNTQEHSPSFAGYVNGLIDDVVGRHALQGKTIVEIGCGQGLWLARICGASGASGVGFDPSFDREHGPSNDSLAFVSAEYDAAHPLAPGDVVCARHVIEHVPDPARFVSAVVDAMQLRGCALWLETPRVEWILERRAFWDIFYEHCSYFAMPVLASLVRARGFRVKHHQATFGAQYQWLEAETGADDTAAPDNDSRALESLRREAAAFRDDWHAWGQRWRDRVAGIARSGPCVVWGAGAKGVTALNLLDPDRTAIAAVVDLNPRKQGRYVPGTGHRIVPPTGLRGLDARTVLVANGNYLDEIRQSVQALNLHAELVALDAMMPARRARASRAPPDFSEPLPLPTMTVPRRLIVDLDLGDVTVVTDAGESRHPVFSPEAYAAISAAWVRVGWELKHSYTFSWLGRPIIQLPEDLLRVQEAIHLAQPDVIVETGIAHGGSLIFYATLCRAMGRGRVIGIDRLIKPENRRAIEAHPLADLITMVEGSSIDQDVVAEVRDRIAPGERVLVMLDSNHTKAHVLAELDAYADFVSTGSYVIVADGLMPSLVGSPRAGADWGDNNPLEAVREFLARRDDFVQAPPAWPFNESLGLQTPAATYWPDGWLRRVRDTR